jgi:pimeloyl-ACP methyl ester carboxylesterase
MVITGPGGRALVVDVRGPADGEVVAFHHGTPAAGQISDVRALAGEERGVRHVGYTRPGYGESDRHEGRTVADCAADLAAVLDALAIERCFTVGLSGGGPHALACSALLGERVIAAATIGSIAPRGVDGLDWLDGMGQENLDEFAAFDAGPQTLIPLLERFRGELMEASGDDLLAAFGDLVSDVDRATITGEFAEFLASESRVALQHGVGGWFDDDVAILGDWGFDLGAITRPVRIWQGAQDRFVPYAHGVWLAEHVPGARAELLEDEGHLSLAVAGYGRVLDKLLADRD